MISNDSETTLEERVNLLLKDEEENEKPASLWVKAAYSLGHVYNDLCAAMWFSYVLLYLQVVLQMDPTAAGALIFLGQVTDGIATPFAGFLADNVLNRRTWHIIGNGLVAISFPMIFLTCTDCELYSPWRLLYYSTVIILFQIGWALVQITHLSMIPDVPGPLTQRGELTALRYTASVCSSVTFYLITWAVLHTKGMNTRYIGPDDADKFKKIAIIVTIVGIITSLIFYTGLAKYKQRKNTTQKACNLIADVRKKTEESKRFFSSALIYQVSLLYVASRLFVTLSLIYMPLFLDERQTNAPPVDQENGSVEELASVPLVSYLASFVASLLLKYRHYCCGKKIAYFAGSVVSVLGCIWVAFILTPDSPTIEIYLIAVLIGAGSSVTIVISLCMTADLIGPHTNQGAFVYSIVTFTDKLITGFAVVIIERIKCDDQTLCPDYYRDILGYACGGAALFGLIVLSTLSTTEL